MKIDVYFTPLGLAAGDLAGRAVVVIDVLRATSTIVSALAAGAKAIVPAASSEEVVRLTTNLEKNGIVLAGRPQRLIPFVQGAVIHGVDLAAGVIVADWSPEF